MTAPGRSAMQQHERPLERTDAPTGTDAEGRPVYAEGYRRADGVWVCPPAPRPATAKAHRRATGFGSTVADGCLRARRQAGAE